MKLSHLKKIGDDHSASEFAVPWLTLIEAIRITHRVCLSINENKQMIYTHPGVAIGMSVKALEAVALAGLEVDI